MTWYLAFNIRWMEQSSLKDNGKRKIDSVMGTAILLSIKRKNSSLPAESDFSVALNIIKDAKRNLYLGDIWSHNGQWSHLRLCKRFRNALQLSASCIISLKAKGKTLHHNSRMTFPWRDELIWQSGLVSDQM
jgi:hypothetical protein